MAESRLCAEPNLNSVTALGQPVERLGEIGCILDVESDLGNAAPKSLRAREAINDVPSVDQVRLDVEPLTHPANLAQMERARRATRYTYQTGVSFGGDTPTAEFDVELAFSFIPGRPETPPAHDHGGLPADPDMIEDVEVVKIDGKVRPWDLCGVSDDELTDHILDHLHGIETDLIAHAVEAGGDDR